MKAKNDNENRYRHALTKIAEMANAAVNGKNPTSNGSNGEQDDYDVPQAAYTGCTIRSLPQRLLDRAADVAAKVNPANAPVFGSIPEGAAANLDRLELTVLTSKYWGPAPRRLSVSFMEPTPADLRRRILSHMNAWSTRIGISFAETTGVGQVRISRRPGGYWSYLGTDILLIPRSQPTMNLEGFSMATPESEYRRVVRHETGHTLGFPHEHMRRELIARIDPPKAYDYFRRCCGWDRTMVDRNVLTPLDDRSIMGTPPDQNSIMCYHLPGEITRDGRPITGGRDINATDYAFASRLYPRPGSSMMHEQDMELEHELSSTQDGGWDESEDVPEAQILEVVQATLSQQEDSQPTM